MSDPFQILGVAYTAGDHEIVEAYRHLARRFHPDQHPEASPAERARWTEAMATINEAYNALKDPVRRKAYLDGIRGAGGAQADRPTYRPPGPHECLLCGHGPVIEATFQHQRAYLLGATLYGLEGPLCGSCALAIGRSHQNRTMWLGWWGIIAFFRNFWIIWKNGVALRRAAALDIPRRSPAVVALLDGPLPPGKSVFKRSGVWASAALLAIVVSIGSASEKVDGEATWAIGNCVEGAIRVRPVSCSAPHSGRIVAVKSTAHLCPDSAESYVSDGPRVYCIDDDR